MFSCVTLQNVDVLSHYIQLEILAYIHAVFGCLGRYEDCLEFYVLF